MANQKRGWAEDFLIQVRAQKCVCIGFKKRGIYGKPGLQCGFRSLGNESDGSICFSPGERRIIRRMNGLGEEMEWRRAGDQLPQLISKRGGFVAVREKNHSGLGAELASTQGERSVQSRRDCLARVLAGRPAK